MKRLLKTLLSVTALLYPFAVTAMCRMDHRCFGDCYALRSYENVGGQYCTVCGMFCDSVALSKGGKNASRNRDLPEDARQGEADLSVESEDILFINVSSEVVRSFACTNPDAAQILVFLGQRSRAVPASVPANGDATAERLSTCASVLFSISSGYSEQPFQALLREMNKTTNEYSSVTWNLRRHGGDRGTLILRHRIVDPASKSIRAIYPDVEVELKWIATGPAGYWEAIQAKATQ